ncbi:hypothetical protein JVT61DRAFT_11298 [Boletus reticuloceps]|uniref:Uncharacterized protein n=1 Tax=Boletus reticuloceps TaxID=495285 RepID=A0A8I2YEN6_9AGAM|nr:hypothetical protein JVT61DRAFT_11298 [Boletus reticuloceps]
MTLTRNPIVLRRYFAERGIWDDTLETFINSDGDPSQFAVSLSRIGIWLLLTCEYN